MFCRSITFSPEFILKHSETRESVHIKYSCSWHGKLGRTWLKIISNVFFRKNEEGNPSSVHPFSYHPHPRSQLRYSAVKQVPSCLRLTKPGLTSARRVTVVCNGWFIAEL